MDARAAKLALARQKLKSHQEKKSIDHKVDYTEDTHTNNKQFSVEAPVNSHSDNEYKSATVNITPEYIPEPSQPIQYNPEANLNATEILISSKRNLELQVADLQTKLAQFEINHTVTMNNTSYYKQKISNLENEHRHIQEKYVAATEEIQLKEITISELNNYKTTITDENNNLQEQLEFTKSILSTKESENSSLNAHLRELQYQLDTLQLQLQQMTGSSQQTPNNLHAESLQTMEELVQKNGHLEQQLKSLQKEIEQINSHYEHYVGELNKQLQFTLNKNQELSSEVESMAVRENSLIEQISDMEIRIQNFKQQPLQVVETSQTDGNNDAELSALQQKHERLQINFEELNKQLQDLQMKYTQSEARFQELSLKNESKCEHENISLTKLTADIASDKVAAQRATEQNKKLKTDLQELEEAFVKISRDKLELTEKIDAEKFLNRELTIKLAEIDEKAKDMHSKLKAKDDEMIRILNNYRELERTIHSSDENHVTQTNNTHEDEFDSHNHCSHSHDPEDTEHLVGDRPPDHHEHDHHHNNHDLKEKQRIPKEDAMIKLQDRFLRIMDEVANLSDEKHRLEHIILQLQNETDTICEYVALYQQQRSLLKKRDEERSAQIILFQSECETLKRQLEELSGIIMRIVQDTELAAYFQTETRSHDIAKIMNLLMNLKNNTLVDAHKINAELKGFYPCSCCSGNLIEV